MADQTRKKTTGPKRRRKLGEILLAEGLIDSRTLMNACEIQKIDPKKLGQILIGMGVVDDVEIANALASQKKLPFVRLLNKKIPKEAIDLVPASLARKNMIVPIKKIANKLYIASADPLATSAVDDIHFFTQMHIAIAVTPERDLIDALDRYYPERDIKNDLGFGMEEKEGNLEVVQRSMEDEGNADELLNLAGLPPVVRFTNAILAEAINLRASDVHIEPQKDALVIRNRIDGVMVENLRTDKNIHPSVVSRIKIISSLDISIRRKPQDGKAQVKYGGKPFDLRVSTIPTSYGEKITIRILNPDTAQLEPEQLGFNNEDLTNLLSAIRMPQGIILVTGPTGSGKSSTLYACLKKLNKPDVNIVTVEDPVEFDVKGINQVQINPKAGITFAAGLRSILRQDPDIVMLGEIRDAETSRIAFQAAQTGHLVLSTLHTNDAPSAVTRLMDLGIEDFMISGSLLTVLGQRLARRICPKCKVKDDPDPAMIRKIQPFIRGMKSVQFWKGAGCDDCQGSGYSGRLGLFEVLMVTTGLRRLIRPNVSSQSLKEAAKAEGFHTMTEDGVQKALDGLTTLAEVFRVAAPETESEDGPDALPVADAPPAEPETAAVAGETTFETPVANPIAPVNAPVHPPPGNPPPRPAPGGPPVRPAPSAAVEPPAFIDEPPAFIVEAPRILVADDNKVIREMLKKALSASDYNVTTAENGAIAMDAALKKKPDLIITDLVMPEMDGFQLLRKLKENPLTRNIPVLMLTASDEVDSEVKVIEAGADDYLVKPVNARRFMARVQRLLKRYSD